jgi:hypothetical protein
VGKRLGKGCRAEDIRKLPFMKPIEIIKLIWRKTVPAFIRRAVWELIGETSDAPLKRKVLFFLKHNGTLFATGGGGGLVRYIQTIKITGCLSFPMNGQRNKQSTL